MNELRGIVITYDKWWWFLVSPKMVITISLCQSCPNLILIPILVNYVHSVGVVIFNINPDTQYLANSDIFSLCGNSHPKVIKG